MTAVVDGQLCTPRPARAGRAIPISAAAPSGQARRRTCTDRARPTWPTTRCRPAGRRTGGSPRCAGCADCEVDAPFQGVIGEDNDTVIEAPDEVDRPAGAPATRRPRSRASPGYLPTDRPSARAWAASSTVLLIDVPAERRGDRAGGDHLHRRRPRTRRPPAHVDRPGRRARAGARSRWCTRAAPRSPTTSRSSPATARSSTFASMEEWAGDAVHLSHHHLRVGRDATVKHTALTFGGDLVRVVGTVAYDGPGGDAELHRAVLRRRRPAPRAPAVRRSRGAALQVAGAVQGRAAGPEGAHGLDRRRADPQGRRGHRHLRDEPQPGAHRGRARRLGAEPGDRDRRDRRRRPRQRHRTVRRRAVVLPAVQGHPAGGRQAPGGARLLRRGAAAHRHSVGASSGPPRSSNGNWPSPASDVDRPPTRPTARLSRAHIGVSTHMATLDIRDLHVSVTTDEGAGGDPARRRPDRSRRTRRTRSWAPTGPASRPWRTRWPGTRSTRSPGHRRPSTARTCWR